MACMRKKLLCGLLASVPVLATNAAVADTFTFELTWSGQWAYGPDGPYGNSDAKASAVVVVEAPASDPNVSMDRIRSMTMTVGDAVVGNGTFSQRDFTSIATPYRLLPTLALNERFWLTSYNLYDFTFFGKGNGAPTQFANYTLWSGGVQGSNALYMSSMYVTRTLTSAVPEPATAALLLGGLALVGAMARRRSSPGADDLRY